MKSQEKIEKILMTLLFIIGTAVMLFTFTSCATINTVASNLQKEFNPTSEQIAEREKEEEKNRERKRESYKEIKILHDDITDTNFVQSKQLADEYMDKYDALNEIRFNVYKVQKESTVLYGMQLKHVSEEAKYFQQLAVRCGEKEPIAINRQLNWSTKTDVEYYISKYIYFETAEYEISENHAKYILSCKKDLKMRISGMSGTARFDFNPKENESIYIGMNSLYQKIFSRKIASK